MSDLNWKTLETIDQVEEIIKRSHQTPYVILKHSTTCPISSMAKFRLEGDWDFANDEIEAYYLDLLAHRDVSNYIAEKFSVWHESPQILLIKDGECNYDASHLDITVHELKESLAYLNG